MPSDTLSFGEKLKELRKNLGKSQIEVVEEIEASFPNRIRISQTTLSSLEQRATAPRQEVLEILSQYYQVPITYFFDPQMAERERIERAKAYIEAIRSASFSSRKAFARTEGHRKDNDEVAQSLTEMLRMHYGSDLLEEDKYLDT